MPYTSGEVDRHQRVVRLRTRTSDPVGQTGQNPPETCQWIVRSRPAVNRRKRSVRSCRSMSEFSHPYFRPKLSVH